MRLGGVIGLLLLAARAGFAGELRRYEAGTYTIYTDVGEEEEGREARLRMSKMGEEYRKGTVGWFTSPRERMPFYLFREEKAYLGAGGKPGSAGMFTGGKLMAFAGERTNLRTWQVVQ